MGAIDKYIKFIHLSLDNIPDKYKLEKEVIKGNLSAINETVNKVLKVSIPKKEKEKK